jgi:hypothetical protein
MTDIDYVYPASDSGDYILDEVETLTSRHSPRDRTIGLRDPRYPTPLGIFCRIAGLLLIFLSIAYVVGCYIDTWGD